MVTIRAAIRFSEDDIPNKSFHIIVLLINDPKIRNLSILFKSFLTAKAFGVRMNVIAIKKSHDIEALFPKHSDRINRTRRAAYMKQKFHSPDSISIRYFCHPDSAHFLLFYSLLVC